MATGYLEWQTRHRVPIILLIIYKGLYCTFLKRAFAIQKTKKKTKHEAGAGVSVPPSFKSESKMNAAHAKCDALKITSSPAPLLASSLQSTLIGHLMVRTAGWARAAEC